jgi:hypothetical protein
MLRVSVAVGATRSAHTSRRPPASTSPATKFRGNNLEPQPPRPLEPMCSVGSWIAACRAASTVTTSARRLWGADCGLVGWNGRSFQKTGCGPGSASGCCSSAVNRHRFDTIRTVLWGYRVGCVGCAEDAVCRLAIAPSCRRRSRNSECLADPLIALYRKARCVSGQVYAFRGSCCVNTHFQRL